MTFKNLKDTVAEIQKLAKSTPPPPPPSTSGTKTTPSVPGTTAPAGTAGNIDIMTMQHALQDLAHDVSSQINLQDAFSGDPRREQEAKARDAFGVFLTKNYMRNTKVPGIEYDPDPQITEVSQKGETHPTRMSVVMDTMNRVGSPKRGEKGEFKVDGDWGPRTNAAIRNSYAFATGLFEFVDDVNRFARRKIQVKSYDKASLKDLESVTKVDSHTLTQEQKVEAAPLITQHVKAIRNMYDEVKKQILEHGAYQQFIEGDATFKSYQPKVTQQQIDLLKKNFPNGIDVAFKIGKVQTSKNISIDNLVNLNSLKTWIEENVSHLEGVTPETVVSQIWKQQEKLLGPDPGF